MTNINAVLDAKAPSGPLEKQWSGYRDHLKLVAPNNRRKFEVLVVGSGLAGAAAAATLGEAGYNVKCFCFQDSPRRAHSIAAQGGINAAKNYRNDGDSTFRLFYDTIKGGVWQRELGTSYGIGSGLLKVKTQRKPATKARPGVNPFTGEQTVFKAKPARTIVKIQPLKALKDMAI